MQGFDELLMPERLRETQFGVHIPGGWEQGRGAFGGLVLGMMVQAMELAMGDGERRLRSLTAELMAPAQVGDAVIDVQVLRVGNGVSTLVARLLQQGEVQAHAVGVFGKERPNGLEYNAIPALPWGEWQDADVLPVAPPMGPAFGQHFEFRPTAGIPFTGDPEAVSCGWVRPAVISQRRDDALLTAWADAWWPTCLVQFDRPRPTATLTFSLQILGDLEGLPLDAPLFHAGKGLAGTHGYVAEQRTLTGIDGRLLTINFQTFAIIR